VDRSGLDSCPVAGFDTSTVETLDSAACVRTSSLRRLKFTSNDRVLQNNLKFLEPVVF
jgi:hypothetical protein